jgi:hypothetical protein
MTTTNSRTFIVDCNRCKAKVAANETGSAVQNGYDDDAGEPYGHMMHVGICPICNSILVGEERQTGFLNYNSNEDIWSDIVRVYPDPPKIFSSYRIPQVVQDSLIEADRTLQAGANMATCAMLGRALEAICRDILNPKPHPVPRTATVPPAKPVKKIMLAEGIKKLKEMKIIDDRLFDWSQQLHAFRNLAAHADEDTRISREDAEDLQTFVYAIVEYVYDLAERYNEFKNRVEARAKCNKPRGTHGNPVDDL